MTDDEIKNMELRTLRTAVTELVAALGAVLPLAKVAVGLTPDDATRIARAQDVHTRYAR